MLYYRVRTGLAMTLLAFAFAVFTPASPATALVANPSFIRVPADLASLQEAINQISDGGVIEIAAGTYASPASGFNMNARAKGFTIRATTGATVVLDGGNARSILQFQNADLSQGRPVTFRGITFANGLSTTEGLAAGVTMRNVQATFINCIFQNNFGNQPTTGGGAVVVATNSTVFFFDSKWTGNSAKFTGGGLEIQDQSKVYIYRSQFVNNRTNLSGHAPLAAGGAIHLGNSTLQVANTRFENNQAGYVGGAIYAVGEWADPVSIPRADVLVVNSTFVSNHAIAGPGATPPGPTEAGAIHFESQTTGKIYNSRFVTNSAQVGGAVNSYRAILQIYSSVFQGNAATGSGNGTGFGGAINAFSIDGVDSTTNYGAINRRPASLTEKDTLIQGRYGSVTTVAQAGGGVYVMGDYNRTYGANGVPQMGTVAENRATLTLKNVIFYDLDVQQHSTALGTGLGAALLADLANLTLENSLIVNSDAIGNQGSGGGMAILEQTVANITNTTIVHNSAGLYGGGVFVQGSEINLSNSTLAENVLTTVGPNAGMSFGAAIFTTVSDAHALSVTGAIANNIISNNTGLPIFDDDRTSGPINDVRYNGNQIYSTTFGNQIYTSSAPGYCCRTVAQLNSLVITRASGVSTAKSQVPNVASSSPPSVGMILAAPPTILTVNAYGDPAPPTASYLAYAWTGGTATLDGSPVSGNAGLGSYTTAGTHTLAVVGKTPYTATFSQGPTPNLTAQVVPERIPSGGTTTLSWSITGTFADIAIDQGVTATCVPSGSAQVSPTTNKTYYVYGNTQEGGTYFPVTVTVGSGTTYGVFLPMIVKP